MCESCWFFLHMYITMHGSDNVKLPLLAAWQPRRAQLWRENYLTFLYNSAVTLIWALDVRHGFPFAFRFYGNQTKILVPSYRISKWSLIQANVCIIACTWQENLPVEHIIGLIMLISLSRLHTFSTLFIPCILTKMLIHNTNECEFDT